VAQGEQELQRDPMATVEARRELGPEYDAELVASFCDRIDATIQRCARV